MAFSRTSISLVGCLCSHVWSGNKKMNQMKPLGQTRQRNANEEKRVALLFLPQHRSANLAVYAPRDQNKTPLEVLLFVFLLICTRAFFFEFVHAITGGFSPAICTSGWSCSSSTSLWVIVSPLPSHPPSCSPFFLTFRALTLISWAGCSGSMHLNHLGALCGSYTCIARPRP